METATPILPIDAPRLHPKAARWRFWLGLAIVVFFAIAFALPIFYKMVYNIDAPGYRSDHVAHLEFIVLHAAGRPLPSHGLYHMVVYSLNGFRTDLPSLRTTALWVLTALVALKAAMIYAILLRPASCLPGRENSRASNSIPLAVLLALLLLLAAPLTVPIHGWINASGRFYPSLWHNPTLLMATPFCLALALLATRFLHAGQLTLLWPLAIVATLGVYAKPNYFLAFVPAMSIAVLLRFGLAKWRKWMWFALAVSPAIALLFWQRAHTYQNADVARIVALRPFGLTQAYGNFPLFLPNLVASLLFPLTYLILFRRQLVSRPALALAWGVFACAFAWAVLFVELKLPTREVDTDGNFVWGAHLSILVLFLVTALDFLHVLRPDPAAPATAPILLKPQPTSARYKQRIVWATLGLHALAGIWMYVSYLAKGRYY